MSCQQIVRAPGQWSLQLVPDAPPGLVASLPMYGRIVVVPGRLSPVEYGDDLLRMARYVGVLRTVETNGQMTLSGSGMEMWLGREDGSGDSFEAPGVTLTSATFPDAIRALLPPGGAVTEGTLHTGVPGAISSTFAYQTPRSAIDYVCRTMGGSWRVNGDATLDAGPESALYVTDPTCLIVRKDAAGYDVALKALAGDLSSTRDATDYTTRVVLIAAALAGGTADAAVVPYLDPQGNPVRFTRIIDESDDTLIANAPARAQAALAQYSVVRRSVRLSVDEFDVAGDFSPGDTVWVYDPDAGIFDVANEMTFRGQLVYPMAIRVLSLTWPVTADHTVAFRDGVGNWVDLTSWIAWEEGGGEVEVADSLSTPLTPAGSTIGTQVSGGGGGMGDAAIPGVPVFGTFGSTSYQPDDGLPRAAMHLTWTQPLNTDGSTMVDGDRYEIRYRVTGTSDWQITFVAFDQTSATVANLPPSTGYDWSIRCVDVMTPTNYGAWSATTTATTADDVTAPGTPAAPSVAASKASVQVTHTLGLASGGTYNLPLDMDHLEVHVGTSSGFVASTSTLVGTLRATATELAGSIPVVGTFDVTQLVSAGTAAWVKVVAVDRTGNRSTSSAAATATATLWDEAWITSLTASKITAGTITAAVVIGGSATFSGALSAATGTFAGSLSAATGTFAGSLSAATGTFAGSLSAGVSISSPSISGGSISGTSISGTTITGSTLQTAASGGRVVIGAGSTQRIDFYSSSGDYGYIQANNAGSNQLAIVGGGGSNYIWLYNGTSSLNSSGGVISANSSGWTGQATTGTAFCSGSGNTLSIDAGSAVNIGTSYSPSITLGTAFGGAISLATQAIGIGNAGPAATGIALHKVSGQLRPVSSSRRYKGDIEYVDLSEAERQAVLELALVTYADQCFIDEADGDASGLPHYWGVIAEDVAGGPLDRLVIRGEDGQLESFMYDRLTVLLARIVADQDARLRALEGAA